MWNSLYSLSLDASRNEIYGAAGRVFEERKTWNPDTDFNKEIWYLAGDAEGRDFRALAGMTKEQVAREMGDYIVEYVNASNRSREERRRRSGNR